MRRAVRCGARATLVECDDHDDAIALWHRLTAEPPDGVSEAVVGARTVLVVGAGSARLRETLLTAPGLPLAAADTALAIVPTRYDGADLDAVAGLTGLSSAEVVARHSAPTYAVSFGGFVPGFAYLTGLDPALRLPRRDSPRTTVPAGSVAIADEYSGVYPSATPGGWHLLGTTTLPLFDATRTPAATLRPGMRVRFEVVM